MPNAILGMRGTGEWSDNEQPEDWRMAMLQLFPNGTMPLLGITSMMESAPTSDPTFHWFVKKYPARVGEFDKLYTTRDGTTAFSGTGSIAQGRDLFFELTSTQASFANELRDGHTFRAGGSAQHVLCRYLTSFTSANGKTRIHAKLLTPGKTGANLAFGGAQATKNLAIAGSASAQGADRPPSTSYDPEDHFNYCQIFREAIELTRTAVQTDLRSRDPYGEKRREALRKHGENMEKSLIYGERYVTTGSNGKLLFYTEGIMSWIARQAEGQIKNFSGTWGGSSDAGEDWIDENLTDLFKFGGTDKLAIGGAEAVQAISRLVKKNSGSEFQYTSRTMSYGIEIMEWTHSQGRIYLKTHPLFSQDPILGKTLLLLEPRFIVTRTIMETEFIPSPPNSRIDAVDEEFKAELGWEYHHPETFQLWTNVGG